MEDVHLKGPEIDCVKKLAAIFETGDDYIIAQVEDDESENEFESQRKITDKLNLPPEKRSILLEMMETLGLLEDVEHGDGMRYIAYKIRAKAILVARQIEEKEAEQKEPEDIVDKISGAARKHPVTAWIIIVFLGLTAAMSLVSNLIQILQTLRLMPKP